LVSYWGKILLLYLSYLPLGVPNRLVINQASTFIVSFSWSFVCVYFYVITWLLNFFSQDYIFHAHVLSSFDPSAQRLHRWSRLCRCMSPQKLFLLLSLTYSRTRRS
jgi:hypothetical protein